MLFQYKAIDPSPVTTCSCEKPLSDFNVSSVVVSVFVGFLSHADRKKLNPSILLKHAKEFGHLVHFIVVVNILSLLTELW